MSATVTLEILLVDSSQRSTSMTSNKLLRQLSFKTINLESKDPIFWTSPPNPYRTIIATNLATPSDSFMQHKDAWSNTFCWRHFQLASLSDQIRQIYRYWMPCTGHPCDSTSRTPRTSTDRLKQNGRSGRSDKVILLSVLSKSMSIAILLPSKEKITINQPVGIHPGVFPLVSIRWAR